MAFKIFFAETLHKTNHVTQFKEVYPGEDCSFNFATMHEKQRHKRSESLKLHQVFTNTHEKVRFFALIFYLIL